MRRVVKGNQRSVFRIPGQTSRTQPCLTDIDPRITVVHRIISRAVERIFVNEYCNVVVRFVAFAHLTSPDIFSPAKNLLAGARITAQKECPRLSPDALVLYNNDRGQFIRKTFNNRWLKAVRAVQSELGRELNYTFHVIKAKAISDFEGSNRDKQLFSGHKTESHVLIYDRKVQINPMLDRPVIGEK